MEWQWLTLRLRNENISLLSEDDVEPTAAPRGRPKKRIASVQDDVHLEFIISKYGNPMVVMEGEIYKFQSKDKNGTTHWGCIKSNEGCKTCLETNSSNQCVGISEGRHNHCTDKVEIEVRKIKSKVRVLACQDQSTPRQIYANVMENASQAAAARLDFNDISQIVYYHRQDEDPKLPCNPAIMIIPNELMMYKNEIFVLHDTGPSTRRMIVFSTPKELLEESEYWGLDGTFDLVPKGFKQLLSIHAKKSSGTYNRFFAVLKQSVPHSQVRHSHVDYERSLMNSFNNAFPVVDLHGCFFHFAQCLSRKVQKFGLIRHYKEGGQLCLLVKMLKSLVYVPVDDVKDTLRFYTLIVQTWIGVTISAVDPQMAASCKFEFRGELSDRSVNPVDELVMMSSFAATDLIVKESGYIASWGRSSAGDVRNGGKFRRRFKSASPFIYRLEYLPAAHRKGLPSCSNSVSMAIKRVTNALASRANEFIYMSSTVEVNCA
uniref:MULE transposase domain-containing protein n=1 Tax=Ditylenchus dipsaci TaxID=166011 RepID=A0A915EAP3_9BILA